MSNEMTVFSESQDMVLAPEFQALVDAGHADDLGGGIGGSYGILSMRGGKFRVKYQGTETPLLNEKNEPVGSVEAVIVKANPYLTKQYYEQAYSEGDNGAPVCFSTDGKVPSANVENPVHSTCALCPMNRFGSRVTPQGTKVKACQDNKKLAIVPLGDLENKSFGGPMLFRVPASALKDLLAFSNKMSAHGFMYNAVAVRIGLDIETSYPKPTFTAMRPLNSEEATTVLELYNSDQTERLLADFNDLKVPDADTETPADSPFEQDAQPKPAAKAPPPPPPAARPAAKPAPAAVAKPAATAPKAPPAAAKPAVAAKPAAPPAPPAARPAAAAKPVAAKPAARPAPPPPPVEPDPPAEEAAAEEAPAETSMEDDIASILGDLNAPA